MACLALAYKGFSFAFAREGGACGPCVFGPLDWEVEQGAFALLTGATGSGKTTLLRCAKPEIAPVGDCAGAVEVAGRAVAELPVGESAQMVGYVAQNPESQLVCDTVWHQMAFGLENMGVDQDVMHRRVAEVAHFFGMEPWFSRDVNSLSGGQKQLLNLASVLVMRPRLLLLDEPTAELDPVAQKNFSHALFRLNRELGITVVVATHAPEEMADYATCAVRLDRGLVSPVPLASLRADAVDLAGAAGVASGGADGAALAVDVASAGAAGVASVADAEPAADLAVCLREAYFRYNRDAAWVLRGLDARMEAGRVHAIVGGNASGKSTLLQVIAGALAPERGSVSNAHAQAQALLPQNPKALFVCDTVLDELREWQKSCGYSDGEVQAALCAIGLDAARDAHPFDLSGGQQQLLALAKLLLAQPRLLLLDEPTKGLDSESKVAVAQLIERFVAGGNTVVMSTHDLSFALCVADTVHMLFDGHIACSSDTAEFFRENWFYRPVADGFYRAWNADANGGAEAGAGAAGGGAR